VVRDGNALANLVVPDFATALVSIDIELDQVEGTQHCGAAIVLFGVQF
jgi:hypothetical protein